MNFKLYELLSSEVNLRRCAYLARVDRKTVARRVRFLGHFTLKDLQQQAPTETSHVQFDELETIEHTKLRPVSVPLAVDATSRRIIAFEVCRMPAKGLLSERSRKKYGPLPDERPEGIDRLLQAVGQRCLSLKSIRSDSSSIYAPRVKEYLPGVLHEQVISRKGSTGGQGEIKRGGYDPIFALNHTCAMLRANVSRLIRKTWCTTKRRERLKDHLAIYCHFHNNLLIRSPSTLKGAS